MNKKKKLYYLIAGLAILSMGATYSATSMLEIGPFATITGSFPELEFVDTTTGDTSFEIEANGDHLQIGTRFGASESVRIFSSAIEDSLVVAEDGIGAGAPAGGVQPGVALTVGGSWTFLDAEDPTSEDWAISHDGVYSLSSGNIIQFGISETAPTASLLVGDEGTVLMGAGFTGASNAMADTGTSLHVLGDDGSTSIKVEEASPSAGNRDMMELVNNGGVQFALDNMNVNERWLFTNNAIGDFNINRAGTGGPEMRVTRTGRLTSGPGGFAALDSRPNGNLFIAGTLFESSDRDKKENFEEVDCDAVLKQIADLSITTWNYKSDTQEIRHMGPVAQDFRSAFKLGDSDKTIATTDKAGVTLAAIKALNSKLQQKESEIETLDSRLEEKDGQIGDLKKDLNEMNSRMKRLETLLQKAELLQ